MRLKTRIILSILLAVICNSLAAQESLPPELTIPSVDAVEEPPAGAIVDTIDETGTGNAGTTRQEIPREAVDFVRGIALLLIPQRFEDLFEKLIRKRVVRENKDMATRINTALEKNVEQLEIPFDLVGWFSTPVAQKTGEEPIAK